MILILGSHEEQLVALVAERLRRHGAAVAFVAHARLLAAAGLSWTIGGGDGFLRIGARTVPLTALTGVLVRPQRPVPPDAGLSPEDEDYLAYELQATVLGLLHALPCPVVNLPLPEPLARPAFTSAARLQRIVASGFRLPATLATADRDRAARFFDRSGGLAILGTLSGQVPPRLIEGAAGLDALLAAIARHPVYLQRVPPGRWLDVFVVADRVMAVSVLSGAAPSPQSGVPAPDPLRIDCGMAWPTPGASPAAGPPAAAAVGLPSTFAAHCCALTRALHLDFAHLRLVCAQSGEACCLDISAHPVCNHCAPEVQDQIATALADLLARGERRRADDPRLWYVGRPGDGLPLCAPVR